MPKHHVLIANSFRGGVDAAIQITLDRPEGGGASGAPLEEAISWGKIRDPHQTCDNSGRCYGNVPDAYSSGSELNRKK